MTTSLSLCLRLPGTTSSQDNCHLLFWTQRARRILNSAFQFMIKNMCYGGRHQSCGGHRGGDLPNISRAHGINAICFTLHIDADRRVSRCCWFFNVWHAQRGTSCESTCGLLRHVFLSLDVRLKIHVARTAVWERVCWLKSATLWGHAQCFHGDSTFPLWVFAAPGASG